jgi:hypothetical protein
LCVDENVVPGRSDKPGPDILDPGGSRPDGRAAEEQERQNEDYLCGGHAMGTGRYHVPLAPTI